jgi:SHS2 domain-containing protein
MTTYPQGSVEIIDHTADVGILVKSSTLGGLFEVAGLALTDLITSVETLDHWIERQFRLQEEDLDTLMVSWLQELIYLFETENLLFGRFQLTLQDCGLEGQAWGEPFNPESHAVKTEIKAVTYHQLEVAETEHGWQARVIFDI